MRYNKFLEAALSDAIAEFATRNDKADMFLKQFLRYRRIGKRDREWIRERFFFFLRHKLLFQKLHGFNLPHRISMVYDNEPEQGLQDQIDDLKDSGEYDELFNRSFTKYLNSKIDETSKDSNVFKWLNIKAETTIRANFLKISREDLKKELLELDIKTKETDLSPAGLIFSDNVPNMTQSKLYKKGFFEFQDEASQLSSLLVKNTCKTFYEPCAGAGGKSLAVHSFFPKTKITNSDIRTNLFKEIQSRSDRAGARIETISLEKTLKRSFNTVFVDAPCSGSGVLRRNPGDRWTISEKLVTKINKTQKEILIAAAKRVRDGGELIYVTCSFLKEENEHIVEDFLKTHENFELADAKERLVENIGKDRDISSVIDGKFFKTAPLFSRDLMFGAILRKK